MSNYLSNYLIPKTPALLLAPMQGLTDAPMRALQGEVGAFTFAVSEFLRISSEVPSAKLFRRHVPELSNGAVTRTGLAVQVQLLGGHDGRMAESAAVACAAGARAIDINFGCPAPTVNKHDGGAALLKEPQRIREIVRAVRDAVPREIPVSAKLRLGWDSMDSIFENAAMAEEGGADWITIHGRTRVQGYSPPAYWNPIGAVRAQLSIPVVANGDLWSVEDFRRCREETGCVHFMLGRGALANPLLSHQVARELSLTSKLSVEVYEWATLLRRFVLWNEVYRGVTPRFILARVKHWLNIAGHHGNFAEFETVKRADSVEEVFAFLDYSAKMSATATDSPANTTEATACGSV